MSERIKEAQAIEKGGSGATEGGRRRLWWVLPLLVLFVLLGIIYLLSHLSSADSEMYPTTLLQPNVEYSPQC